MLLDLTVRVEALEAQIRAKNAAAAAAVATVPAPVSSGWTWLGSIVSVYSGTGVVPFTTFDMSAYVPATAVEILFQVRCIQQTGSADDVFVNYRTDSTGLEYFLGYILGGAGDNVGNAAQWQLPCKNQMFDYEVDTSTSPEITIELIAYR